MPISRVDDGQLTCEAINSEITQNEIEARHLAGLDEGVVDDNVAAGVGSVIVWPIAFAMDLSNKEQIELRALHDRNQHLDRLKNQKDCQPPRKY